METTTEAREIIRLFGEAMERKLARRDDRPSWRSQPLYQLKQHLIAECDELRDATLLTLGFYGRPPAEAVADVLAEACDVALLAMMVADHVGALPQTGPRGHALEMNDEAREARGA